MEVLRCVRCQAESHTLYMKAVPQAGPFYGSVAGICQECYQGHQRQGAKKKSKNQGAKVVSLTVKKVFRAHCSHCKVSVLARCNALVLLRNGNRAMKGECPHCHRPIFKLLGRVTLKRKAQPALLTSLFGRYAMAVNRGSRWALVLIGGTFFGLMVAQWVS